MDIYTVFVRLVAESLALTNGTLANLVNMPENATGPLDPNITLTTSGLQFVQQVAGAAIGVGNTLCDMFEALF
jgi:hypothetical protein